jgi:5-methylthioadenosine/S-adenosylhomocysteine deaminase
MIRTGTTTFNDMYFMMNRVADAVDEAGIRACLSYCMIDDGNHDKFESECSIMEKSVATIKALANPRIMPGVSPHAVYTVSEEGLRWCAEFSKTESIPLHIHVGETDENQNCIKSHGMRVVPWLDHCGVLSERCIAAHCCWLDANDIRIFADRGVTAVHNPISNMKLAVGRVFPYPDMKTAGINVTLGTDGASSNNDLDMFSEMKTASLLQKFFRNDPTIASAGEMLTIASRNGAKALGLNTGIIAVGYLADIILVGRNPANFPAFNTVSNAVYATSGLAVDTTICNGVVLMHEGRIPGADEVLQKSEEVAFDLARRTII